MKEVELRMNEQNKYEIIKELVDHKGNKNNAALKLGISKRHVNSLLSLTDVSLLAQLYFILGCFSMVCG